MDAETKQEIITLAKTIDAMDYYQILKVRKRAFTQDIKTAYFNQSRRFHPDKFYNEDPRLVEMVNKIFKRVCEAYKVLSDQDKRATYTKAISGDDGQKYIRYNPKLYARLAKADKPEDEGQTPMGKKYYQMAQTGIRNKDYKSAKINLQLAIKMEPSNQTFKERLAEVDELLKMRSKKV